MPVFHRRLIDLRVARSKSSSSRRDTDKEHGAAALGRWRRHQHIASGPRVRGFKLHVDDELLWLGLSHSSTNESGESTNPNRLTNMLIPAYHVPVYHLGIPAANHDPAPVTRIRSTGLAQGFGGAGESVSSMRKSPFT